MSVNDDYVYAEDDSPESETSDTELPASEDTADAEAEETHEDGETSGVSEDGGQTTEETETDHDAACADDRTAIDWEINRALDAGIKVDDWDGYTAPQLRQIRLACRDGDAACVKIMTGQPFNYLQMELIRKGFSEGIPVEKYARPDYDVNQMWEIMEGLRCHIDVSEYAMPSFSADQMRVLREALTDGIPIASFCDPELDAETMRSLRSRTNRRRAPLGDRIKRACIVLRGSTPAREPRETPEY